MRGVKLFQLLVSIGLVVGGLSLSEVHASSVSPPELDVAPVDPSPSDNPEVVQTDQDRLSWELDLNSQRDERIPIESRESPRDEGLAAIITDPALCPAPTPVPLPAAIWLLGSGLLALSVAVRRRKIS